VSVLNLACSSVTELVTEYLERALGEDDQLTFETHVVYCPGCSVFLDQIRTTVAGLEALPAPEPVEDDLAAVLAAYAGR
jgi:hypothetical protein